MVARPGFARAQQSARAKGKRKPKQMLPSHGQRAGDALVVTLGMELVNASNGSHGHWTKKAERAKHQRGASAVALRAWMASYLAVPVRQYLETCGIVVTLVRVAPRELDDDNIRGACKHIRDGVADALGLASDRDKRVTWEYEQERGEPRTYGARVRVEARQMANAAPTAGVAALSAHDALRAAVGAGRGRL